MYNQGGVKREVERGQCVLPTTLKMQFRCVLDRGARQGSAGRTEGGGGGLGRGDHRGPLELHPVMVCGKAEGEQQREHGGMGGQGHEAGHLGVEVLVEEVIRQGGLAEMDSVVGVLQGKEDRRQRDVGVGAGLQVMVLISMCLCAGCARR